MDPVVSRQDPGTAAVGSTGVSPAKNTQVFAGLRYSSKAGMASEKPSGLAVVPC